MGLADRRAHPFKCCSCVRLSIGGKIQFMSSFGPQKNLSRITAPFATQIKKILHWA